MIIQLLVGSPFLFNTAFIFPKILPLAPLIASHLVRNSFDSLSRTSPLATATRIGLVLLQLGDVSPSAIISSIISSGTGVERKSRVDRRDDTKELKSLESKSILSDHTRYSLDTNTDKLLY